MLPLKHKVRRKDRKGKAGPDDGLVCLGAKILPSGHATDHSPLKKNQCDRKAASHPLPVLLNLPLKNEDHCNPGSNHPQCGVRRGGNTERSGITHSLLEVLDVKAEWRGHEYTCDVDSADYTMEPPETIANPVCELHWAQQQSARTGDSMGQQPPLKGFVVLPHRILRMYQKTLIVRDNVGQHQADGSKR